MCQWINFRCTECYNLVARGFVHCCPAQGMYNILDMMIAPMYVRELNCGKSGQSMPLPTTKELPEFYWQPFEDLGAYTWFQDHKCQQEDEKTKRGPLLVDVWNSKTKSYDTDKKTSEAVFSEEAPLEDDEARRQEQERFLKEIAQWKD